MDLSMIGAGIAQGAAEAAQYDRERPMRQAQLDEAYAKRDLAKAQVEQYKQSIPSQQEKQQMELEQTRLQLRQLQQQSAKSAAFDAFRMYQSTNDTKYLNTLLQQWKGNPAAQSLMGTAVRVDPISEQDSAALQRIGIRDVQGYLQDNPGNIVKVTNADGSQQFIDMGTIYAGTGYTQAMSDADLEREAKRALITTRMRQGDTRSRLSTEQFLVEKFMEEDPSLTWSSAYAKVQALKTGGIKGTTETERLAKRVKEEAAAAGEEIDDLEAYDRAVKMKGQTSKQKDLSVAEDAKAALDEAFPDYFSTDFSKPENRRLAEPYVRRIEELSGAAMTTAELKQLGTIRQLISLGKAGSTITAAETGPIDTLLRSAKKYISDDISGTAATSAYETYRNLVRNALFGASLTNNEMAAFNKSFGTLTEQTGPVLAKLRTQLNLVKDQLENIYYSGDEYVMKYRTGMSMEQLDEAIYQLNQRLELFDKAMPEGTVEAPTATRSAQPTTSDQRKPLEEIFQ